MGKHFLTKGRTKSHGSLRGKILGRKRTHKSDHAKQYHDHALMPDIGIILILAGLICMMDPWVSVAAIGVTVGLVFLLEGISSVIYACIPREK